MHAKKDGDKPKVLRSYEHFFVGLLVRNKDSTVTYIHYYWGKVQIHKKYIRLLCSIVKGKR